MNAAKRNSLVGLCAITSAVALAACSSSSASGSGSGAANSGGGGGGAGASTAASSSPSSGGTITVDGIQFPKPEKTSLSIGVSSIDVGVVPTYLLTQQGLAKKFGIDLTEKDFSGDAPTVQALVAGQVDVIDGSGSAPLLTQVTNEPAEMVFVNDNTVSDVLFTQKDITSAAQLKGKSIAVSSVGSFSYAEAALALQHLGLTTKDVTLQAVGHDSDRLAALKAGSVGGAIQDNTLIPMLTKQGFHALVNLGDVKNAHYVGTSLAVPESFAQKYPNTTLDLAAMEQLAQAQFHLVNSVATNAQIWAKVSGEPLSQATSDIKIQLKAPWVPANGKCDAATQKFMQTIVASVNAAVAKIDPQKACTDEFTNKLAQMGFTKALKIPTS